MHTIMLLGKQSCCLEREREKEREGERVGGGGRFYQTVKDNTKRWGGGGGGEGWGSGITLPPG